jgi:hypothetical protein
MTGSCSNGTVVVGVIDDGLAFAHDRFRNGIASRVEYWWLQDGIYLRGPTNRLYGRELGKADIDALLVDCTSAGLVNEDELYQRAGLNDFRFDSHKSAAWLHSHGTHVMDLASGYDAHDARDDRPIVCVQLPARVTADTSGADLRPFAMAAIDYILECADRIAQDRGVRILPVVINLSYGTIGGPHDGTSFFERYINWRVAERKARGSTLDVVIPAGNGHLSRCHAQVKFDAATRSVDLLWRILPDDQTPSYLDIWLPPRTSAGSSSRIEMTVTPPGGGTLGTLAEGAPYLLEWVEPGAVPKRVYCQVQYLHFPPPTSRGRFRVRVQPTMTLDSTPLAPAGLWTIRLTNISLPTTALVHAWVQRDESLYGHPIRGRQSYFDDPTYRRFDDSGREVEVDFAGCVVRRASLLNSLATGRDTVVVGGYVRATRRMSKYSAGGPVTKPKGATAPPRTGPDAVVPSDDSPIHQGVLAAGSRSGAVVAMSGTSVAGPQIARWLADQRAKGDMARGVDLVRARALADETAPPVLPSPTLDPDRGGSGRVRLDSLIPMDRGTP